MTDFNFNSFVEGYIETMLWSDCMPADRCTVCGELVEYDGQDNWRHADPPAAHGNDEHDAERDENAESGGRNHLEVSDATRAAIIERGQLREFVESELADLLLYCEAVGPWVGTDDRGYMEEPAESRAGHDFYLTRAHHGCGYWDRGLGELGDRLTAASEAAGSVDDHMLYDNGDGEAVI